MKPQKVRNSLLIMSLLASPLVDAEGEPLVFADVFGGYSWSRNQDATIEVPINGTNSSIKWNDLDVHNGPSFGGRIGFWMKTHPSIGIAVDATRFDTDIDNQRANITQVSPVFTGTGVLGTSDIRIANVVASIDLIYRHQGERFTPYIFAGPGILFSSLDDGAPFGFANEDNDVSFAYKAGGGISYKLSDNMHIFTEYRYLHGNPDYEQNTSDPVLFNTVNADVEIDIDSHVVVGGVSIRF